MGSPNSLIIKTTEEFKSMNQQMDKLTETREWYKEELAHKLIESLEKNNISAFYVGTGEKALEKLWFTEF